MKLNENYKNMEESYLFSLVATKVSQYTKQHPEADIIRLGIGDVTLPLPQPASERFSGRSRPAGEIRKLSWLRP